MTRDEVIAMAREAGMTALMECKPGWLSNLEHFHKLVEAKTKAACANECKFGRSSADIEIAIRTSGEGTS